MPSVKWNLMGASQSEDKAIVLLTKDMRGFERQNEHFGVMTSSNTHV